MINSYSTKSIPDLAGLALNDQQACAELFSKLAVDDKSYHGLGSCRAPKFMAILSAMDNAIAIHASMALGRSVFSGEKMKPNLLQGLKIVLIKNFEGTLDRVANVARTKLTRDQSFELINFFTSERPIHAIRKLNDFNLIVASRQIIVEKIIHSCAQRNFTDIADTLVNLANEHFIMTKNAEILKEIVGKYPEFAVCLIGRLKFKKDEKKQIALQLLTLLPNISTDQKKILADMIPTVQKRKSYEHFAFGGIGNQEPFTINAIERLKDKPIERTALIAMHAQKRQHLFFDLLVAFYATNKVFALNDTKYCYGVGVRGQEDFDACHSSIITSLKLKETEMDLHWDEASFFDLYLAHACNSTFYLPRKLNELDCKIEGKNNSSKMLRQLSVPILNDVSKAILTPEEGMKVFLKQTDDVFAQIHEKNKLTVEQKGFLKAEIKGTHQICDADGSISGNFFRWNLALSLPEESHLHNDLKVKQWGELSAVFKRELFHEVQKATLSQKYERVEG